MHLTPNEGRSNFSMEFALRIEVEILLVAERDSTELVERAEAKKDWNEKPGEPFGENALIIFLDIFLCLEKK